ncbi:MAG: acyl-CoA/acyl-ACP dehydrogenase [Luminiphilus sp.]|nr:acyl-CoA/acyl-ACP dehydrogenase [Luminiphilus sp.]
MDFDFTEDQKHLQQEARRFLSANCGTARVRQVLDEPDTPFDAELWTAMADLGWQGAILPEAYGGSGMGATDLCAIAEELGRAVNPTPFASSVYAFAEAVNLLGSEQQKSRILPHIASGHQIGCIATAEGAGRPDLECAFVDSSITGRKVPVTDGDVADWAIALANDSHGESLYLIELKRHGVSTSTLPTLDPTRSCAEIKFAGASAAPLGEAGSGKALLQKIHDRAAVFVAFEQLGGAEAALATAQDYAQQRYAFGRAIGSFQAVKHKLARIYVANQIARSNCYFGAWALESQSEELPRAAAAARIAATRAFQLAASEMIEIFGGIGTTWETDCHLFYRRAKQLSLFLGPINMWKERLAAEIEKQWAHADSHGGNL